MFPRQEAKISVFDSAPKFWSTSAVGGTIRPFISNQNGKRVLNALVSDIIKGIKW